ncbi:hypothetical protein SAMD00079811_67060 [Scytonema sp. HK-05]|nr:hypothetical protein SAMD00079811_67060 [Scytonema sp. HK-05]
MDDDPEINFRHGHFALVGGNLGTQVPSVIAEVSFNRRNETQNFSLLKPT